MNKDEVLDLLKSVFVTFDITVLDKGTWYKIKIDDGLEVYTYSGLPNNNSIWYFNSYYDGHSKETLIPNINSKEFIQVYYDIYKDLVMAKQIFKSVSDRLQTIDGLQNIRDKKIVNIIQDENR